MQAGMLLDTNPRAILEDRPTEPVPPLTWRFSLADRFRALFGRSRIEERP
jgi:hypothetical protein